MLDETTGKIVGLIATALLFTFIIGLAYSISTGCAGCRDAEILLCIVFFVLSMAAYDLWDEQIRKKK